MIFPTWLFFYSPDLILLLNSDNSSIWIYPTALARNSFMLPGRFFHKLSANYPDFKAVIIECRAKPRYRSRILTETVANLSMNLRRGSSLTWCMLQVQLVWSARCILCTKSLSKCFKWYDRPRRKLYFLTSKHIKVPFELGLSQ